MNGSVITRGAVKDGRAGVLRSLAWNDTRPSLARPWCGLGEKVEDGPEMKNGCLGILGGEEALGALTS